MYLKQIAFTLDEMAHIIKMSEIELIVVVERFQPKLNEVFATMGRSIPVVVLEKTTETAVGCFREIISDSRREPMPIKQVNKYICIKHQWKLLICSSIISSIQNIRHLFDSSINYCRPLFSCLEWHWTHCLHASPFSIFSRTPENSYFLPLKMYLLPQF